MQFAFGSAGSSRKLRRRRPRDHPLPACRADHCRRRAGDRRRAWRRRDEAARCSCSPCWPRAGARRFQPAARLLGQPPASRRAAGSAGPGADGRASLPRLPGPVDRRFRRRDRRRHARPRPPPDRRRRAARGHPRLAGRALRQLGQLSPAGRAGRPGRCGWRRCVLLGAGALVAAAALKRRARHERLADPCRWSPPRARRACGCSGCAARCCSLAPRRCCSAPPAMRCRGGPALPARRARRSADAQPVPLTAARHAFFGQFTGAEHWLMMSEALAAARQDRRCGRRCCRSAVREHPGDPQLWVGLGNALVDHARRPDPGQRVRLPPRGASLRPAIPAPPFFFGLALLRSGDRDAALALWREVLAGAPADAGWRPLVEDAVAAVRAAAQALGAARTAGRALRRPPGGGSCRPRH